MHEQLSRRIVPQSNFRAIYPKYAGPAARRHPRRHHFMPGKKAKLHKAPRQILRKIQSIEDAWLANPQLRQSQHLGITRSCDRLLPFRSHRSLSV